MKEKIIKNARKYLICFGIMAVITVIIMVSFGFFEEKSLSVKYTILSDAFSVPGMVMLLVGALIWISTTGFFDALAYGVGIIFKGFTLFKKGERFERYYEYKVRKAEKRTKGYGFILISGAIYLLIGVIFILLFLSV